LWRRGWGMQGGTKPERAEIAASVSNIELAFAGRESPQCRGSVLMLWRRPTAAPRSFQCPTVPRSRAWSTTPTSGNFTAKQDDSGPRLMAEAYCPCWAVSRVVPELVDTPPSAAEPPCRIRHGSADLVARQPRSELIERPSMESLASPFPTLPRIVSISSSNRATPETQLNRSLSGGDDGRRRIQRAGVHRGRGTAG